MSASVFLWRQIRMDILTDFINKIGDSISEQTLSSTLNDMVRTAVQQRTTVGITGLLMVP
nr:hypothetical protein [Sodalis-like endosymbiont of Proechinophthirus fluctus]